MLATVQVTGVGTMAASCLCQVVDDGGAEVTERGACWDTRPHPDNTSHVFANGERKALSLYFEEDYLGTQSANRSTGCAVRLVYDCPVR